MGSSSNSSGQGHFHTLQLGAGAPPTHNLEKKSEHCLLQSKAWKLELLPTLPAPGSTIPSALTRTCHRCGLSPSWRHSGRFLLRQHSEQLRRLTSVKDKEANKGVNPKKKGRSNSRRTTKGTRAAPSLSSTELPERFQDTQGKNNVRAASTDHGDK